MLKVLFGIVGLVIGGWAGFSGWLPEEVTPFFRRPITRWPNRVQEWVSLSRPYLSAFLPAALAGCWLGVLAGRKTSGRAGGEKN